MHAALKRLAQQPEVIVAWQPRSRPQRALIKCRFSEVFLGGARGGGKTDAVLGKWAIKEQAHGEHFNAVMFRRTTVSSEDAIERSRQIYTPLGGKFNESKLLWRMPKGGRVAFAYLDSIADADEYQGRNLTDIWVEEAGQYPDPGPIDRLFGTMRSAHGVPTQMILTANPGGAGQHWLASRYKLIPFPRGPALVDVERASGIKTQAAVIPSRITDNVVLLDKDPGYVDRLRMVGSNALVRAWLEGDWSAIEGAFFDCWNAKKHVVAPFAVPKDWLRFRSFDWGSAAPFSVGWWAVAGDDHAGHSSRRACAVSRMVWSDRRQGTEAHDRGGSAGHSGARCWRQGDVFGGRSGNLRGRWRTFQSRDLHPPRRAFQSRRQQARERCRRDGRLGRDAAAAEGQGRRANARGLRDVPGLHSHRAGAAA